MTLRRRILSTVATAFIASVICVPMAYGYGEWQKSRVRQSAFEAGYDSAVSTIIFESADKGGFTIQKGDHLIRYRVTAIEPVGP